MQEDRKRILNLLSEGKITTEEADRLLGAIAVVPADEGVEAPPAAKTRFNYLCVIVEPIDQDSKGERVNIRVPLRLLRAGMKLTSLLPKSAGEKIKTALGEKGIDLDLDGVKGDALKEIVKQLAMMTIDVQSGGQRVRVFCE